MAFALTITIDISLKGFIFRRKTMKNETINNKNGTMMVQFFSLKAIPKSSQCHIITALSWPRQARHTTHCFYSTEPKSARGPYLFIGRFDTSRIKLIQSRYKIVSRTWHEERGLIHPKCFSCSRANYS